MTRSISPTDYVLIFPTVQRLTASSPPLKILHGIHGLKQDWDCVGRRKGITLGIRRKRSCSRISALSSIAPPAFQTKRSPYQSKTTQRNLSATLKSCGRKSDAKFSHSAWERRPASTSKTAKSACLRSISVFDEHHAFAESDGARIIDIVRTDTSNSLFLPPEVSPANKFVPIGHEVDDDDSFASDDYDICKEKIGEDNDWAVGESTIRSPSTATPPPFRRLPTDSPKIVVTHEKYSQSTKLHQPPSSVSLDNSSSQNSADFVQREGLQKDQERVRDKYCIPLDYEDDDDWFPNMKQEILKVASLLSNCGATDAGS
jgi:hypothetical protein